MTLAKKLKTKTCFYIRSWMLEQLTEMKAVATSGYPVVFHAEDLQRCHDPDSILELFSDSQLQIISFDVDDQVDHLEVAFRSCLKLGFTHMIFLDQFPSGLIERVLTLPLDIEKNPEALVCLVGQDEAGGFLKKIFNRALSVGDDDYLSYRTEVCAYPIEKATDVSLKVGSRLNWLRLLLYFRKENLPVTQESFAGPLKKKRYRFFEKLEMSYFDSYLLLLSVWRQNYDPKYSAISLAMGIFLACTPFYGLQTFLILFTAIIFRLSFPIAFIGSQVSLPPIYSLLVPLQIYIGSLIRGETIHLEGPFLEEAQSHFVSWLYGSLVVGSLLALSLGLLWYGVQVRQIKNRLTE